MWQKLKQSMAGDDEDPGESYFNEESDGLCSLSPTQVPLQRKKILTTKRKDFIFQFRVLRDLLIF